MVIDEKQAPYIRKIFELYATGDYSLKTLRTEIIRQGFITNKGYKPCLSHIEHILKSPIYIGEFNFKGKRYENAQHEAIIDKITFKRVRDIMTNPTRTKSRKDLFTYSNMISCDVCGCNMTAEIKKGKYVYYHCTGNRGGFCKKDYINQNALDETILAMLENLKLPYEDIQRIILKLKEQINQKESYHNAVIDNLRVRLDKLSKNINKAYIDKLEGKISEDFWEEQNEKMQSEKDEINCQLLENEDADKDFMENINIVFELAKDAHSLFLREDMEGKRKILNVLCSNFSYSGGELHIELNSPFDVIFDINTKKLPVNIDEATILEDNLVYISKRKYPGQDSNL